MARADTRPQSPTAAPGAHPAGRGRLRAAGLLGVAGLGAMALRKKRQRDSGWRVRKRR